ncbi:MAG TPA: hypothetical protein VNG51_09655 [Ktedonobacteraceae bacterium]|nr:hypothetical protein [Ktedonobacteraceae bacterium]
MTRKDSEKDADRPHYYSQFWLDVAAGRRVIGAPRTDEGDTDEGLEPVAPRRTVRSTTADNDGYRETVVHPQVEPEELEEDADEYSTPDVDTFDTGDEIEEDNIPTFGANEDDIPDVEITPEAEAEPEVTAEVAKPEVVETGTEAETGTETETGTEAETGAEAEENEEEDFFDEEEDEEDEDTWTARGRKKPKPGRQTKLPTKTPPKRAKREPRRGF